jgi:hypothetical protein
LEEVAMVALLVLGSLCLAGLVILPVLLVKAVFCAVLLPFRILGVLVKGIVGLLSGLAGLAFGLVVAVLAMVAIPLMLLLIPLLPFLAIGGIVWLVAKGASGGTAIRA